MIKQILNLLFFITLFLELLAGSFKISIVEPSFLKNAIPNGIKHKTFVEGINKRDHIDHMRLIELVKGADPCKKYPDKFINSLPKNENYALLLPSYNCSIGTLYHFSLVTNAKAILVTNIDDNLDEIEFLGNSLPGSTIPILFVKKTIADEIYAIDSSSLQDNKIIISLDYKGNINKSDNKITLFMSPILVHNAAINFLHSLVHDPLLSSSINFEVLFEYDISNVAEQKKFMKIEEGCLSGGRFCVSNVEFNESEVAIEGLRSICLRNEYGIKVLSNYLLGMHQMIRSKELSLKTISLLEYSKQTMNDMNINFNKVNKCFIDSFEKEEDSETIDPLLNDNSLLRKEQESIKKIKSKSSTPLVIINGITYDQGYTLNEFLNFACSNDLISCKTHSYVRNIILMIFVCVTILLVFYLIIVCKRRLNNKIKGEMNVKVQEAISKYMSIEKA